MIKNEQGEEMIFNSLSPYQLFEDESTHIVYAVIVTRTGLRYELILLSMTDNVLPNRYFEALEEQELIDLMNRCEFDWIYKGSMPKPTYTFETKVSEE